MFDEIKRGSGVDPRLPAVYLSAAQPAEVILASYLQETGVTREYSPPVIDPRLPQIYRTL